MQSIRLPICGCADNGCSDHLPRYGNIRMQTIAIVLIVLWALGLVSGYALGGLIHLLLVIAIVVFLLRFITGRRIA
jgi:hypothetical protein